MESIATDSYQPMGSAHGADPSALTVLLMQREIQAVKDYFESQLESRDRATTLLNENFSRVPTELQKEISHLKEYVETKMADSIKVSDEKFNSVNQRFAGVSLQFNERDTRTDQVTTSSKVAVDAALQAAKEAVQIQQASSAAAINKSDAATAEQIRQLQVLLQTTTQAGNDKLNDVKERLVLLEGLGKNEVVHRSQAFASSGSVLAVISVIISFIVMAVVVTAYVHK